MFLSWLLLGQDKNLCLGWTAIVKCFSLPLAKIFYQLVRIYSSIAGPVIICKASCRLYWTTNRSAKV